MSWRPSPSRRPTSCRDGLTWASWRHLGALGDRRAKIGMRRPSAVCKRRPGARPSRNWASVAASSLVRVPRRGNERICGTPTAS
eukprot:14335550-Alexandrium_andersonii.AAC.1